MNIEYEKMFLRFTGYNTRKKKCKLCGREDVVISEVIGVCSECLRNNPEEALAIARRSHVISRGRYGLPGSPPKGGSVKCNICANECELKEGEKGFCGLVENRNGRLYRYAGFPDKAVVDYYYDPLPTNCVAEWFCPATTGLGYPKYAVKSDGERGFYNLAVFYGACNLDCIFCQNWSYRENTRKLKPLMSARELASKVHDKVTCICFFGGDPSPQIIHAIATSRIALKKARDDGRILRICWETNGLMNPKLLEVAVKLSLESGGIFKFDIKAWTPSIYEALTGVSNKMLFENFKLACKYIDERPEVPLVMASTLLVPGYVDVYEVRMIARFIASIDPEIPYSLLAFHPDYMLTDLPPTSRIHALECLNAAKEEGLKNINIGNIWLLGDYY